MKTTRDALDQVDLTGDGDWWPRQMLQQALALPITDPRVMQFDSERWHAHLESLGIKREDRPK